MIKIIVLCIVLIILIKTVLVTNIDYFQNPIQILNVKNIYDKFYAPVYSSLISDQIIQRTQFESTDLIHVTQLDKYQKAYVLDIGCGGGDHLKWLSFQHMKNVDLVGIDSSEAMLQQTKKRLGKKNSRVRLLHKNLYEDDLFMSSSISHITCYYFTIYTLNTKTLIPKIKTLLRPNGWFVTHIVNMNKFDPILDVASPFWGIDPQKYVKNRITESTIFFKKFVYKSNFKLSKTKAIFEETFAFKTKPKVRKQTHVLEHIDINDFVNNMGKEGLELKHTTSLEDYGYHHQYILYFQKT